MIHVIVGDILDIRADAMICSANPHLRLSGGVGGALLQRGGNVIQEELDQHLDRIGRRWVETGTVVRTGTWNLQVQFILHAVAIPGDYRAESGDVERTVQTALQIAVDAGCRHVTLTALATGYGKLKPAEFGRIARKCDRFDLDITIVVPTLDKARQLQLLV